MESLYILQGHHTGGLVCREHEHYGGPGQGGDLLISGRFFIILNYILVFNCEGILIFYKVMSILSLEYLLCFFPQRLGGVHDDVGEEKWKRSGLGMWRPGP